MQSSILKNTRPSLKWRLFLNGKHHACIPTAFISRNKSSSTSYNYLQQSSIPTFKFQNSLPRLPIPDLNKTCQRYLDALKPIIGSSEQYQQTQNLVKKFENGAGIGLQADLIQLNKRNKHTSYICQPWFEMYLKSRLPLPLNYNPFMAMKDDVRSEYNTPLLRATNMIVSAMRFRRSLVENVLEPEVFHLNPAKSDNNRYRNVIKLTPSMIATYVSFAFKAFPLDMSQFNNLFSSTRIPKPSIDELITFPKSKHVAVLKNGQFYTFDVLESNGDLKEPSDIMTCLKYIIDSPTSSDKNSITVLTTEDRDIWSKAREELVKNKSNEDNLNLVDSAQFVICLDDKSFTWDDMEIAAHNFLHGCDKKSDIINRWFDKSFSLIYTADGHASINFEHSWGDGVAVLRFFNEMFKDTTQNAHAHPNTPLNKSIDVSKQVRKLDFELNDSVKNTIKEATQKYHKTTEALQLTPVLYDRMNRDYFKNKKLSPDSMFQLAFQLAFWRVFDKPAATYESCSTAAFKHGRTETVRSATNETKAACDAFLKSGGKLSAPELRAILDKCSKKHFQLTKEAAMGQGCDRHLFGLKMMAEKSGGKLPEIFTDKSYADANHFTLSTSTLFGEAFQGGGFAAVVPDGFGCGYGYIDNILGVLVSSYSPHRNGKQFADAFIASLDDIKNVLEKC